MGRDDERSLLPLATVEWGFVDEFGFESTTYGTRRYR